MTKKERRYQIIWTWCIAIVIAHLIGYVFDKINGSELFMAILGYIMVSVVATTFEFDTDEETFVEDCDTKLAQDR